MTISYLPQLTDCCSSTTTQFPFANYVMVEWFGAAADGVTDDSDAFVRAMTDGRPIGLAANRTYAVKNVIIPVDTACSGIFAPAGEARIVAPPVYVHNDNFFLVRKTDGFSFEGITFDMPRNEDPAGTYAFNVAIRFQPTGALGGRGRNYRVERCSFYGAASAISGVGFIVEETQIVGNYVTGTFSDGIVFNAMINCEIVDNVMEDGGLATGSLQPSGAIRTGTNDQFDSSLNVDISRNTITRYSVASRQSAIDCFSGAARNLRITDNILSYNGAGIELKTMIWTAPSPLPPGANDKYDHNVIADNTIRLWFDRSTTGITVFHAFPGAPKGKAQFVHITGNMITTGGDVDITTPGLYHVGISVQGHDNVLIDGNFVLNCAQGIEVGGAGPVGDTADHIVVSDNTVDTAGSAFHIASGTVNNLYIRNNPLLRSGTQQTGGGVSITYQCDDLEVSNNFIENQGTHGIELRSTTNARLTDNKIKGVNHAIVTQSGAVNGLDIRDNELITSTDAACNFATGSNIRVQGNNVDIPIGLYTVTGAAGWTASDNKRGMATANPTATAGGCQGDTFFNSAPTAAGYACWICLGPPNGPGSAVYKGSGLIEP